MMKFFARLFVVAFAITLIWVCLPSSGLTLFGKKIPPPIIDLRDAQGAGFYKVFRTHLGLDLVGGSHFVFEADTRGLKPADIKDAVSAARAVVERRVNAFGIAEPTIQTSTRGESHRISVDLPGIQDPQQAISLLGQTAQLQFKEEGTPEPGMEAIATIAAIFRLTKPTGLTGKDVQKATVVYSQQTGQPVIQLTFSDNGRKLFRDITKRNVGKPVGIFIDNAPLSAPTVQTEIPDGQAIISGDFTPQTAKKLAVAINSGALPVPLKLIEEKTIGPTLGASEIQKSMIAGGVGLLLVSIFMLVYYGRLGAIAIVGLTIYAVLSYAVFRIIGIVLTLPGLAGFILSIGMAVDSNILIFERIKEEIRAGKPHARAISSGFGSAIHAIKDANITTLLIAAILFNPLNWSWLPQFGLIRGFAATLAIGVLMSLFTGVFITKKLLQSFSRMIV